MGHYYAEMVDQGNDEADEQDRQRARIENAVKLGVKAGVEAGRNSVGLDRDGLYAKKVRISDIVKKVMRFL